MMLKRIVFIHPHAIVAQEFGNRSGKHVQFI